MLAQNLCQELRNGPLDCNPLSFEYSSSNRVSNITGPLSTLIASLNYLPLIATVIGNSFAESVAKEYVVYMMAEKES